MHVSNRRSSRSRVLVWCAGLIALCAQASSFFSCSFGTTSSIPILPPPPPAPTPSVTITVKPTTIVLGESAVLTWSSIGVSACTASGAWSGPQSMQGNTKVTPPTTGSFAYVLNCSIAPSGSIAQSATLTVDAMAAAASARQHILGRGGARVRRTDLVADVTGSGALGTDPYLSEPWGVVLPQMLPAVVASRLSNTSTFYPLRGGTLPDAVPPLLHLPGGTHGLSFGVRGVVANSSDGFIFSVAGREAPARVVYAGTEGMIAAWSPEMDRALTVFAADDSASYTGLAIATSSTPSERHLYATDFHNGRIDVLDTGFGKQAVTGTKYPFIDPALPPGYAPFGIAVIEDLVYVAYAQRPASSGADPVTGAGLGLVGVFTPGGDFITRLIGTAGALNAPWAIVRVPAGSEFPFAGALLVGNSGDGTIHAFDVRTGTLLGSLADERGAMLVIANLHGLAFGNGSAGQPRTTLFFTAGANGGVQGWYGRLDAAVRAE